MGSSHSGSMVSGPSRPSSAPSVAPVQSVSWPQLTAAEIERPKVPPPASQPSTVMPRLAGVKVKSCE